MTLIKQIKTDKKKRKRGTLMTQMLQIKTYKKKK